MDLLYQRVIQPCFSTRMFIYNPEEHEELLNLSRVCKQKITSVLSWALQTSSRKDTSKSTHLKMVEVTDVTCLGLSSITEKLQKTEQQVGVPAEQHPGLLFVRETASLVVTWAKGRLPSSGTPSIKSTKKRRRKDLSDISMLQPMWWWHTK